MNSLRITWTLVALFVLATIAVTLSPSEGQSNAVSLTSSEPTPQPQNPYGDISKYPVADLNQTEPTNAVDLRNRRLKNKRYENGLSVVMNPNPVIEASIFSDAEPTTEALPFAHSDLVILGVIQDAQALLSDKKKTIFSEFSVRLLSILKHDPERALQIGEIITADRSGGVVRYPSGQTILHLNDWQDLPEVTKKYFLFLKKDDEKNPNYKIITAYEFKEGSIVALDKAGSFSKFNGMKDKEFINLILSKSN